MKNHRSTVVGFAILVVLMTAGAAQSLSGSNTVFSDDIAAGNVRGSDLAANSVSGSKIYPNSVTGADINESTLALPPTANGAVSKTVSFTCPVVQDAVCTSVPITMPSPGTMYVEANRASRHSKVFLQVVIDGDRYHDGNSYTRFAGAGAHTVEVLAFVSGNCEDNPCDDSSSGTLHVVAAPAPAQ